MPRVNLARLKTGVQPRDTSLRQSPGQSCSQASISSFFTPKRSDDGNIGEVTSRKRLQNESTTSPQNSKRQKLSCSIVTAGSNAGDSNNNNISSITLTKLKSFEKGSKYFSGNDDEGENNTETNQIMSQEQESELQNDCIIIDNEVKTSSLDVNCFSRKGLSRSPSSNAEGKPINGPVKSFNQRTKSPYTPLELQFMEIKSKYKDALLFVECGYKYKFFGDDAQIAAKELNIMCSLDHNFMVASIPTHRLHVHLRRLVSKGYKVGVVKQTETAALKAVGNNKSNVFTRELYALYTKSTLIGEDMKIIEGSDISDDNDGMDTSSTYLMCLCESHGMLDSQETASSTSSTSDENITYGFVAVQPSTGDIIFDEFQDSPSCSELETRLQHIGVAELLIPVTMTTRTKSFIKEYATQTRQEDSIRIEEITNEQFIHDEALKIITSFTEGIKKDSLLSNSNSPEGNLDASADGSSENTLLQRIVNLPRHAQICFATLVTYLKDFKLEGVMKLSSNFIRFSTETKCMKLNGCTIRNLELLKNENGQHQGTLFWILNHTKTSFGKRLLKKWISQPLLDPKEIESRLDCVTELLSSEVQCLQKLKALLSGLPDLERGLCSIYSKKCSASEFVTTAKALTNLSDMLYSAKDMVSKELSSSILVRTFTKVPELLSGTQTFLTMIDENAARTGDKTQLFKDLTHFPEILKCNQEIQRIMDELKSHRSTIRQTLQNPSIDYCCVSGNEFLVEVRNARLNTVPSDWIKISSTKQFCRFRTPFVEEQYKLLCQQRELLSSVCNQAWMEYLEMFNQNYTRYHRAVRLIADVDCLMSLATVAKQPGYTRPIIKNDTDARIHIVEGRHPILDALLSESEQYVPNDTNLKGDGTRCMIITGPNMGGKSCYIKQVALIAIMAQVGSYVPADHTELTPLDAIHTRMGASDNIYKGRSTFMVELQEASHILDQATSRSLVILDELGRGTSTHDGIAVAYATLQHIVSKVGCLTLFVTHYPNLAEIEKFFPSHVTNSHMAFLTSSDNTISSSSLSSRSSVETTRNDSIVEDSSPPVTFLYRVVEGVAERSYGLNVARLAGISRDILEIATTKSHELEIEITSKRWIRRLFKKIWHSLTAIDLRNNIGIQSNSLK